jgi:hypothetical protein
MILGSFKDAQSVSRETQLASMKLQMTDDWQGGPLYGRYCVIILNSYFSTCGAGIWLLMNINHILN